MGKAVNYSHRKPRTGVSGGEKGGWRNLGGGLVQLLDAIPHAIGDALGMTGAVTKAATRTTSALVKRISYNIAEKAEGDYVKISNKDLRALAKLEPAQQAEKLRNYLGKSGSTKVPRELLQNSLDYLVHPKGGKAPTTYTEQRLRAAAILFLLTAIYFFDKTSITGYAVSATTGTSLGGYYSLLGFIALGMAILSFAHHGKRR